MLIFLKAFENRPERASEIKSKNNMYKSFCRLINCPPTLFFFSLFKGTLNRTKSFKVQAAWLRFWIKFWLLLPSKRFIFYYHRVYGLYAHEFARAGVVKIYLRGVCFRKRLWRAIISKRVNMYAPRLSIVQTNPVYASYHQTVYASPP